MDLLQLCTLLVKHAAELMQPHRKELMKFGWGQLKPEESVTQSYGYLFVSHFLATYQLQDSVLLKVRCCHSKQRMFAAAASSSLATLSPCRKGYQIRV